ncbi:MAG: O-antigen ligase family protein [Alsobacter sp.]
MSVVLPAECWSIAERPGLAGLTGHPNQLGGIVGIGLIVSLGVSARGLGRLALLIAQAGLVAALLMTKSMTCLTFTFAGIAIFVILRANPAARTSALVLIVPLLAVVACIGLGVIRDDALAAAGKDASLSGRTELWSVVSREIRERPVLGAGYGAFWREGRGRELVATWNPRQSHQAYLDLLLDLGIVGVGIAASILFSGTIAPLIACAARGTTPTAQQASLIAMVLALCGVYAFGESFMLKADKFPFFVLLWSILAMTDARSVVEPAIQSREGYAQEFGGLTR